jgi:hypothetical protein
LVRYVNFAGAKVINSISKVSDVLRLNVRLNDALSPLGSTDVLLAVVVGEVVLAVNPITCASCVLSNAPVGFMEF